VDTIDGGITVKMRATGHGKNGGESGILRLFETINVFAIENEN